MSKFINFLKKAAAWLGGFVMFLWQLPQTVIGLLSLLYYQPMHILCAPNGVRVCYTKRLAGGAFSLGQVAVVPILWYRQDTRDALLLKKARHEWRGHGEQSRLLGWFYLLVIALPSVIHAALHDLIKPCKGKDYHHFYTEKWAEKWA